MMIAQDDFFLAPDIQWMHLSPIIALVSGALLLLVVGALTPQWPRGLYAYVTALTAAVAGGLAVLNWNDISDDGVSTLVGGALAFDAFAQMITITICAATLLVALISDDELRRAGKDGPEVYALFLVAAAGGVVMGSANDLILLFLGLDPVAGAVRVGGL